MVSVEALLATRATSPGGPGRLRRSGAGDIWEAAALSGETTVTRLRADEVPDSDEAVHT